MLLNAWQPRSRRMPDEHIDRNALGLLTNALPNPATAAADLANRHPPSLRTHDRVGNRVDVVDFHPAYHKMMALGIGNLAPSFAWQRDARGRKGAFVARSALSYMLYGLEAVSLSSALLFA